MLTSSVGVGPSRTAWSSGDRRLSFGAFAGRGIDRPGAAVETETGMSQQSDGLERLAQWVGRRESDSDHVTIPAVHRLAATLDRDDPVPRIGDPLPIGWHSILFPRVARRSLLGSDGHPARGDFLPPVPLPRRMFAGKRTTFHAPLLVGDEVRRDSVIESVTPKVGKSGQMVFVTVRTEIASPRGLAIVEEQDIVYREATAPGTPTPTPQPFDGVAAWGREVQPDTTLLFRYSALTFNGHRIHYDQAYAQREEGYPDLVVHGPLTATLLQQLAQAQGGGRPLARFEFRGVSPLFVGRTFRLEGRDNDDGSLTLWARGPDGELAMSASAAFR